jgi:hypothetical protein
MTFDVPQIAVATVATASYALTSVIAQRVYIKRRKRQVRRDARFVARLIDGARQGTVFTAPDAVALYRACGSRDGGADAQTHRIEFLVGRAWFRLLRVSGGTHTRTGSIDTTIQAAAMLRQLHLECRAVTMDELVRRAGISEEDRDRVWLEAQRTRDDVMETAHDDALVHAARRDARRRSAARMRQGLMGVGCIAFVQVVLVVWQALR